jgi:low affinity Fe/Cu permease
MTPAKSTSWFTRFAKSTARATGQPVTFALAVLFIIGWAASGPLFGFSDTWQLVVNTSTTIITFLMVFLIQSTQNRDSEAVQIKLDELLRISPGAHNVLINLEELDENELEKIRVVYERLAEQARKGEAHGREESGVPPIRELVAEHASGHAPRGRRRRRKKS